MGLSPSAAFTKKRSAYILARWVPLIAAQALPTKNMVKGKLQKTQNDSPDQISPDRPDVIVEFMFDRGLLHISVNNIGSRPAIGISVKFNKTIVGLGGTKDFSALALFKNIEFLGPQREIVTLLDSSSSYFKRKQPTKISALVTYQDLEKRRYEISIKHDLEIYRDLVFVEPANEQECK